MNCQWIIAVKERAFKNNLRRGRSSYTLIRIGKKNRTSDVVDFQ